MRALLSPPKRCEQRHRSAGLDYARAVSYGLRVALLTSTRGASESASRLPEFDRARARSWTRWAMLSVAVSAVACHTKGAGQLPSGNSARDPEWEKRDAWQRPAEVMDALAIRPGSVVADVGAGEGYFTFHLASRVGARGKVYAEDILDSQLQKIRERAKKEGLSQIEIVLGTEDDPKLPEGALDAILLVLTYHELDKYDAMLDAMVRAIKPRGLLAVIEEQAEPNRPRRSYAEEHKMSKELVLQDAARHNLRFAREEKVLDPQWFFLVFEKPRP